ncbi:MULTISPECIES: PAS domain-containing sensor histidine kinase [unclassified Coleofasciculus]|uniref:PAS domain-containing sensor histidine kinase n=1 Tax=unclassified Coleofasciculus TaxID=2692782 RepID=UPI00187EC4AC|nr:MULTISPECIES: PAS domain S-box protein [unclassified Coleofasciculus]MBE9127851.1 PAS domain S-box protein [Coleofasciculus sp. LEGE 07081]MBE9148095.1 PAS domain S-box protein [Coleofasciculus sp. LEGE 07092]
MATQVSESQNSHCKREKSTRHPSVCSNHDKFFTLTLDMFFVASADGYWTQINPMCEKILGFTTEEFLAQPWIEWVHPDDRQLTLKQWQQLSACTDTISFENRYRCKDGSYKWLVWNATLCPKQQLVYALARDNTECKQAEAAHQESEERFRLLVEGVKDYAIIMLDPLGYVVSWSTGAERIQQYRATEIIGQHLSCFYTPEDVKLSKPEEGLQIAARQERFEEEGWRVRKDGSQFFANVVTTALQTEDGQLRGFARVTRDITERQFAREALQKSNGELERRVAERTAELTKINERLKQEIAQHKRTEVALEAETQHVTTLLRKLQQTQTKLIHTEKMSSLGQLVAGVAHEINNPVSFIYGNIDYAICYLQDLVNLVKLYGTHYPQPAAEIQAQIAAIDLDFLMTDIPKLLTSMKVGASRIRQVVLSLQKFLKTEQAEMKPADLHEGIDSTLLILQHRLQATVEHPEITLSKEYGNLPLVNCYAGQINQVFMNLISNAIDVLQASASKRRTSFHLKISTEVQELATESAKVNRSQKIPHVVIRIADNGPGMSQEVCRRLFEPFFTTKLVGKGTGLGLSISYQIIVENHNGQLTYQSEPGKGSEFSIALPIRQLRTRSYNLPMAVKSEPYPSLVVNS